MGEAVRKGLVLPAALAVATLVAWLVLGAGAALALLALGSAGLVVFHLREMQKMLDWAEGPLDARVPEGRGPWALVFTAMYRRTRLRDAVQRDLRDVIERFRQAAEAIPDGIVLLDRNHRIEWANPRALAQLGLNLEHDQGQPVVNLVRQPEFLRYLEAGDFGASTVVPSSREPGHALALQLVPFAVDKMLLLSRDVTELEAVSRMRRDFIANVSHELKTPLTVISGFVETLQELDVDERQRRRFLQLMQEQAHNMQRLVSDLLTLSLLESDQNAVVEERFGVEPFLNALASDARALSKGQHAIEVDVQGAALVTGARDELASAFGNLISNAIRYTPAGGSIVIGWRVDAEGRGLFSVRDTGIGIAPEHVPRLTERFYRVDRSRSRATGGTGLGLAIVKHVLLRHQASLDIGSELGVGSTFTVTLPARRVEQVSAPSPVASSAPEATRVH